MDNTSNKYQRGKVYSISTVNRDKVYVGSSTRKISERITEHEYAYKSWLDGKGHYRSSYEIIKCDNYIVDLLENFPCSTKQELHSKEQEWLEKTTNCINKHKACTGKTMQEYNKEYKKSEKYKDYKKEYDKQRMATKIICQCGAKTDLHNKFQHEKTIQHQTYMNQQ